MKIELRRRWVSGVTAVLSIMLATFPAFAETESDAANQRFIWTGLGGDALFSNPQNWQQERVPRQGGILIFPAQVYDCDVEDVHLVNDLDAKFSKIVWGRFETSNPKVPVNCPSERYRLVFVFIDQLKLLDDAISKSREDLDSLYASRLIIDDLKLDGSLTIDGENLYTANDDDIPVFPVTDLTIKNGAVIARERKQEQTFFYLNALFKPSGEVVVGALNDRRQYNGMFELSPEVIGDIDQIICFGCELQVTANYSNPEFIIAMSPNEYGDPAHILHSEYYFEPAQAEVTLTADFILQKADTEAYVDEGTLTVKGTRTGRKFTNPWGINFVDKTKKVK